jgi:NADPH-ferrihemoprotein reductase
VQERVALARRAIEKSGPDALRDWAPMYLFYGCRRRGEDFLYQDEWPRYTEELGGKFKMIVAFSREMNNADGSESSVGLVSLLLLRLPRQNLCSGPIVG